MVLVYALGRRLGDEWTGAAAGTAYGFLSLAVAVLGTAAHATHFVALCALAIIADDLREERLVQLSDRLIRAEYGYYIVTRRTPEEPSGAVGRFRAWLLSTAPRP